jgi:DoxX-like family
MVAYGPRSTAIYLRRTLARPAHGATLMPAANPQPASSASPVNQTSPATHASTAFRVSLWVAQILLALTLVGGAIWKFITPIDEMAKMMPWVGEVAPSFFYSTAAFDLLGGLGVILPSLTRIQPRLTVYAAFGVLALMACAIAFHVSRGEAKDTPFNFIVVGLCLFVAWGRSSKAPL